MALDEVHYQMKDLRWADGERARRACLFGLWYVCSLGSAEGPGDGDLISALRFGSYSNTFGNGFPSIH